ncbi:MAG: hypothetical protein NZM28_07450, partial [Fimbriimonadales bacterium]|nr:hypothetical protein [Fimbriimonadales bacterium]
MQVILGASFRALWNALSPMLGAYGHVLAPTGAARLLESQHRAVSDWHGYLRHLTGVALMTQPTPEMTALLSEVCEQSLSDSSYFGKVRRSPKFHSALAGSFCRWSADGLTPDLLEQGAAAVLAHHAPLAELDDADLQAEWRSKTGELALLWRAWAAVLAERGQPEPIRQWRALLRALEAVEIAHPLLLFGFTEFSALELQALGILASKTQVALALLHDPACPERYIPTDTLLNALRGLDSPVQAVSTSPPSPLSARGEGEQDAAPRDIPPSPFTERGDRGVRFETVRTDIGTRSETACTDRTVRATILDTPNPLCEAETVAREILKLQASGVALSEIVLLVRQPESVVETLEVVFARYGIPLQGEASLPLERSWRVRWLMQGLRLLAGLGEGMDWLRWLQHPAHKLRYEAIASLRENTRLRIPAHRWLADALQHAADPDAQRLLNELRALRQQLQNGGLPQVARALLQRLSKAEAQTNPDADLSEWLHIIDAYANAWRNRTPAQSIELLERLL